MSTVKLGLDKDLNLKTLKRHVRVNWKKSNSSYIWKKYIDDSNILVLESGAHSKSPETCNVFLTT